MKRLNINIGQKFNMLTVLKEVTMDNNDRIFRCQCDCGNIKNIRMAHFIRSKIKSCGCHRVNTSTKHGMWNSREYSTWENMIQRCTNPKARKYYLYGGRGITVCSEWLNSFEVFYKEMGTRPNNTTIDRIDSNKGYYKENCKWSNPREQLVNVREFKQIIKYNDIIKTVDEWLSELHIDRDLFKSRVLRGLGFKEALFCNIDIIVLNINNKQQTIYNMQKFLNVSGFEKEKVMQFLDSDHEKPYNGYLMRYLVGFNNWPEEHV